MFRRNRDRKRNPTGTKNGSSQLLWLEQRINGRVPGSNTGSFSNSIELSKEDEIVTVFYAHVDGPLCITVSTS